LQSYGIKMFSKYKIFIKIKNHFNKFWNKFVFYSTQYVHLFWKKYSNIISYEI
jgi:hypothetical protein